MRLVNWFRRLFVAEVPLADSACEDCPNVDCVGRVAACERRRVIVAQEANARLARALGDRVVHLRCGAQRLRIPVGDTACAMLPKRSRKEPDWLTVDVAIRIIEQACETHATLRVVK